MRLESVSEAGIIATVQFAAVLGSYGLSGKLRPSVISKNKKTSRAVQRLSGSSNCTQGL